VSSERGGPGAGRTSQLGSQGWLLGGGGIEWDVEETLGIDTTAGEGWEQ
jgi:hypothetical protein